MCKSELFPIALRNLTLALIVWEPPPLAAANVCRELLGHAIKAAPLMWERYCLVLFNIRLRDCLPFSLNSSVVTKEGVLFVLMKSG
jgi:hypothetical protein